MAVADRIPIDIGYDTSASALLAEPNTSLRDDGTIVIDTTPPGQDACPAEPTADDEIVVCAQAPDPIQEQLPPPASPSVNERISNALRAHIGPLELGSIPNGDGTYSFGARIRF